MSDMKECCAYWQHKSIRKWQNGSLISKPCQFCPECGAEIRHFVQKVYEKETIINGHPRNIYSVVINSDCFSLVRAESFEDALDIILNEANIMIRSISLSIYDQKIYERVTQ